MLHPFLLIGVGGSGGKTLRVVRQELTRQLRSVGWTGPLPQAWQFLHVDVPTYQDGDDPDLPEQLPHEDYRSLVASGLTYRNIDASLVRGGRGEGADALAGWRPDPRKVNIPAEKGAGQYRALGRVITVAHMSRVKDAVDEAHRRLTGTDVAGELNQLVRKFGHEPTSIPSPVALVVSSIAGGSGAGAVIDVCDALRSLGEPWAAESVAVLYAPDVFDYLPEEKRKGIRPNALATLSELVAGYWNSEAPPESTAALLAQHGVQLGAVERLGPKYSFLVGARNGQVSFATQNDIYRAMGRALASWVSSERLQDMMNAYLQANWMAAATALPDHLPLKQAHMSPPFTGLGFARVTLGRDRFREYASQRLARAAVTRVLERHLADRQPNDSQPNEHFVTEAARRSFDWFLEQSGLSERGEENDQILDALRDSNRKDVARSTAATAAERICRGTTDKGLTRSEWTQRILQDLHRAADEYIAEERQHRTERATAWVRDIQNSLVGLVNRTVSSEGGPVTIELLNRLIAETREVLSELGREAELRRRWAAKQEEFVGNELTKAGAERIPPQNPQIAKAVQRGFGALYYRAEAELRDLAVDVTKDLVDGFLMPLRERLQVGIDGLVREDRTRVQGRPPVTDGWPRGEDVPQRLQPAANEFLVDPISEYPEVFRRLVDRSSATGEAVAQVVSGDLPGAASDDAENVLPLVSLPTPWTPQRHELRGGAHSASGRAEFSVRISAGDLLGRAEQWVTRGDSPIGAYIANNLRDYLEAADDPRSQQKRLERFERELKTAFGAAEPLVNVNPRVLVQVHERTEIARDAIVSELPFSETSPGRDIVKRIFLEHDAWHPGIEKNFGDSSSEYVDLFTVLREPYEPVVFDSIVRPIASEWGARNGSADRRTEFWRWRRARPLPEFVPVAPAVRRAMVRGFFTASFLNQLRLEGNSGAIFASRENEANGIWVAFPDPLITPDIWAKHEYLPAVLESLPLAMLDVGLTGSLDSMAAYRRLRDLGQSGRGGEYEVYDAVTKELERWILTGEVATGAPTPQEEQAGSSADDWEKRRDLAERKFTTLQEEYRRRIFEPTARRDDPFDVPRAWELRNDYEQAFDDLRRALRHLEPSPGMGFDDGGSLL